MSTPAHVGAPGTSSNASIVEDQSSSPSSPSHTSLSRVGRLQTKRSQWWRVIVGLANFSASIASVMALNGLADFTTAMSSTSPPSGTAHSWRTIRVVA
jgi:hypothetical protein